MSTEFAANVFQFGDVVGRGIWEIGHYRQHLRYQVFLAGTTPATVLPDFPIMRIGENDREVRFWLDSHEKLHELLRPLANITGVNLADVDFANEKAFYQWNDTHNIEHALFDEAFGVG